MSEVFIEVLNFSLTAGFIAVAVMLIRLALKKMPKLYSYALWAVVFLRLVCPLTIKTPVSFSPVVQHTIPQSIVYSKNPAIHSGVAVIDSAVNSSLKSLPPVKIGESINPMQIILSVGTYIWLMGMAALLIYAAISYFRIRSKVKTAIKVRDKVYETDLIKTPFVLGFIRPKIYIPIGLSGNELEYILKHEQTHIKRLDYIIKPLAFLIVVIHWFNPIVWLSYILMSRDMELSADESVMKQCSGDIRGVYANSLLSLSVKGSGLLSPLAFSETGVKGRIKNVLNYKKPALWISIGAFITVCVLSLLFFTSYASENKTNDPFTWAKNLSVADVTSIEMVVVPANTNEQYKNFSKEEFANIVSLITGSSGIPVNDPPEIPGESIYFYITTTDGVIHEYINAGGNFLYIDNNCYSPSKDWLKQSFQGYRKGNEPLPEGFWERVDAKNDKIKQMARKLYEFKTAYVGAASKVGGIVGNLPLTGSLPDLKGNGIELFTIEEPYGLAVDYITSEATENIFNKPDSSFEKSAAVLFSLVDNLSYVQFRITSEKKKSTVEKTFHRTEIESFLKEDVGVYAKDEAGFVQFILKLMNTDFNSMNEDGTDNSTGDDSITRFIEKNLDIIMSGPGGVSVVYTYINAHQKEYNELVALDYDMLIYSFTQFEKGDQVGLKGNIIAEICKEILSRDKYSGDMNFTYDTGQGWYDEFKKYALNTQKNHQNNDEFLKSKVLQALTWTLENLQATPLPDFKYSGEDKLLSEVYETETEKYQNYKYKGNSFLIIAPYILDTYEEGDMVKVFSFTFASANILLGNEVEHYSGSLRPTAITYKKTASGAYELEKYEPTMDGSLYGKSIKEFCTMPVSGKEIPGLADKLIKLHPDNVNSLMLENMKTLLKENNLTGIKLRNSDGTLVPLT